MRQGRIDQKESTKKEERMFLTAVMTAVLLGFLPVFGQESDPRRNPSESRENRRIEDVISDFETHLQNYYLLTLGSLHETYVTGIIPVRKEVYIHQTIFLAKEIGSREIEYRRHLPRAYNLFKDFGAFHSICRKLIFNNAEFDAEHKAYCSSRGSSGSPGMWTPRYASRRSRGSSSGGFHSSGMVGSSSRRGSYGAGCVLAEVPRNYRIVNTERRQRARQKRFDKYLENIQTMYAYKKRVEQDLMMLRSAVMTKETTP